MRDATSYGVERLGRDNATGIALPGTPDWEHVVASALPIAESDRRGRKLLGHVLRQHPNLTQVPVRRLEPYAGDGLPRQMFLYVYAYDELDWAYFNALGYTTSRLLGWLWPNTGSMPPGPAGPFMRYFLWKVFVYTGNFNDVLLLNKLGKNQLAAGVPPAFMMPTDTPYSVRKGRPLTQIFVAALDGCLSSLLMTWPDLVAASDELRFSRDIGWISSKREEGMVPLIEMRRLVPLDDDANGTIYGRGPLHSFYDWLQKAYEKIVEAYHKAAEYLGGSTFDSIMEHGLQQEWSPGVDDPNGYVEEVLRDLYERMLED